MSHVEDAPRKMMSWGTKWMMAAMQHWMNKPSMRTERVDGMLLALLAATCGGLKLRSAGEAMPRASRPSIISRERRRAAESKECADFNHLSHFTFIGESTNSIDKLIVNDTRRHVYLRVVHWFKFDPLILLNRELFTMIQSSFLFYPCANITSMSTKSINYLVLVIICNCKV